MSDNTPAIVEDDATLAALSLPLKQKSDLRIDRQGVLYVKTAVPGLGASGVSSVVPNSGAADGQVVVKATGGNLLKAQFMWSAPFEGQLYFQLFNAAAILVPPATPFASVPFTMNKAPSIDYAVEGGMPFLLGLLLAISTNPNVLVPPSLAGRVTAQFV